MEATRTSVTSGNEQIGYNMDPAYQVGYTQQEVDGKSLKWIGVFSNLMWIFIHKFVFKLVDLQFVFDTGQRIRIGFYELLEF